MSSVALLLYVWHLVKWAALRTALITLTIYLVLSNNWDADLAYKTFLVFLSTLLWIYVFDYGRGSPTPKGWATKFLVSLCVFSVLAVAYWVFGLFGLLGAAAGTIIILLLFAAWAVYENWKLFDSVTTWGAQRLRGEHKKEFDIRKVIQK